MIGSDLGLVALPPRGAGGPPLALDFTQGRYSRGSETATVLTALSGTSFARDGAGTGFASGGVVVPFATGIPRITDRGLLLEPAATNLIANAWVTSDVGWTASAGTKTSGQADPTGGAGAAVFTANGASASHFITAPGASVVSGTTVCLSILIKAGSADRVQLSAPTARYSGAGYVNFYLNGAGSVSASGGTVTNSGVVALGGGWYRIWYSAPCTATGSGGIFAYVLATGSEARGASVTTSNAFTVVGAQAEAGAIPSSPIVTAGLRGVDVLSVVAPGNVSTWTAVYGSADTVVGGSVTPGSTFDLVTGRPWLGQGQELKRLVMV